MEYKGKLIDKIVLEQAKHRISCAAYIDCQTYFFLTHKKIKLIFSGFPESIKNKQIGTATKSIQPDANMATFFQQVPSRKRGFR